ncbi:MAG TPA: DinB family protein [Flavobacteriales bacterium]|nr:DinB family protein [Flavobacteriales bacterium]
MKNHFKEIIQKHLDQLAGEINAYENECMLWELRPGISNCAGNLALHLVGNLNHFIGAQLGNTGYVRERDKEFSEKNVQRQNIVEKIEATKIMIGNTFDQLDDKRLQDVFPLPHFGEGKTTHEVLLVLLTHFNYHLGQINYHRRLIK